VVPLLEALLGAAEVKAGRIPSPVRVRLLAHQVSQETGVPLSRLLATGDRSRDGTSRARWRLWSELYGLGFGYAPIGRALGLSHTSVMHGVRRLREEAHQ
jgi:hypothetical protein